MPPAARGMKDERYGKNGTGNGHRHQDCAAHDVGTAGFDMC